MDRLNHPWTVLLFRLACLVTRSSLVVSPNTTSRCSSIQGADAHMMTPTKGLIVR